MPKFFVEEDFDRLAGQISELVLLLGKNEGGVGFLQSGKWKQALTEARERAKQISSAETLVRDSLKGLENILETIKEGVVVFDQDGKILLFNRVAEKLLSLTGTSLDEWLKEVNVLDSATKSILAKGKNPFAQALTGPVVSDERIFVQKKNDSTVRAITVFARPMSGPKGSAPVAVIVSEVVQEEQSSVHKLELLNASVQELTEGILVIEPSGAFLLLNGAARKLLQSEKANGRLDDWGKTHELRATPGGEVLSPDRNPFTRASKGERLQAEPIYIRKTGTSDDVALNITARSLASKGQRGKFSAVTIWEANISRPDTADSTLLQPDPNQPETPQDTLPDNGPVEKLQEKLQEKLDKSNQVIVALTNRAQELEEKLEQQLKLQLEEKLELEQNLEQEQKLVQKQKQEIIQAQVQAQAAGASSPESAYLSSTAEAFLSIDTNGNITAWNDLAEQMFGFKADEVLNTPLVEKVFRPLPDSALSAQLESLKSGGALLFSKIKTPAVRKDGQELTIEMSLFILNRNNTSEICAFPQNVTKVELLDRERAIRDAVGEVLASAHSVAEAAPKLLQAICETVGWSIGFVWEFDEANNQLRRSDLWHVAKLNVSELIKWSRTAKFSSGEGLPGRVLKSQRPLWHPEIPADDPVFDLAAKSGLKSAFAVPIFLDGKVNSVIQFFGQETKISDGSLIQLFQEIGKQLSQFVEAKRAEEQRKQLTAIVDSSNDAIIFASSEGIVLRWNRGAEEVFGFTADAITGRPLSGVVSRESLELFNEGIRRAKRGEGAERYELSCNKQDGKSILVSIRLSPVMSIDGETIGVSAIARDITDRKRKEEEINELNKQLASQISDLTQFNDELALKEEQISGLNKKLATQIFELTKINEELDDTTRRLLQSRDEARANARFKSLFLSTMGREIRTPMNAIMGLSDILGRSPILSDEHRDYANLIEDSGTVLLNVFNDIIEFTRLEDGETTVDSGEFSMNACLEQAAAAVASRASRKKLSLLTFVAPEVPRFLRGDGKRLEQVISRLAEAAISATSRGGIVLRATAIKTTKTTATVRITFSDTGTGMTSQAAKQVFEAITKSVPYNKIASSDLGLIIAKRLVHIMDGEIGIDTDGTLGSMFWTTFDFELGQTQPAQDSTPLEQNKQAKILVVDGPAGASRMVSAYCAALGIQCDWVVTGDEALVTLDQNLKKSAPYDIVIMEKVMFGMNGFALAKAIRELTQKQQPKLILFSPYGDVQPELVAQAGFSRIIRGPLCQSVFIEHLVDLMAPESESTENAKDIFGGFNTDPFERLELDGQIENLKLVLMAEDNSINQKVSLLQLNELGLAAHVVQNGKEVVAAFEKGTYSVILMDCEMPEMDGFEATRAIRKIESEKSEQSRIPIIALTANAVEGDREHCLEAGMDDYISKPVETYKLRSVLSHWLPKTSRKNKENGSASEAAVIPIQERSDVKHVLQKLESMAISSRIDANIKMAEAGHIAQHGSAPEAIVTSLSEPRQTRSSGKDSNGNGSKSTSTEFSEFIDIKRLKRICGDSGMQDIIMEFVSTAQELLSQLDVAVQQRDANARRRIAHELKGSAGALGAKQMSEISNAIQLQPPADWEKSSQLLKSLKDSFESLKAWVLIQLEDPGQL